MVMLAVSRATPQPLWSTLPPDPASLPIKKKWPMSSPPPMAEGREPLLQAGSSASTSSLLLMTSNCGESSIGASSSSSSGSGHAKLHPISQGMNISGLKKRSSSLRSRTCIDYRGNREVIKLDKLTMMQRCNLPSRDLRLLDPIFVYPSTILGCKKTIIVNLE